MFNLGGTELIFLFILALLIFGPKRLPQLGRTIGKGMAEFRRASTELQRAVNTELEEPPAWRTAQTATAPSVAAAAAAPAPPAASPAAENPAPAVAGADAPASAAGEPAAGEASDATAPASHAAAESDEAIAAALDDFAEQIGGEAAAEPAPTTPSPRQ